MARTIPYLVHFTRSENLTSILQHGLRPRSDIDIGTICGAINDQGRYDNRTDRNCLILGFPNYKMFFKLRQSVENSEWPILFLHPSILWRFDCLYCHTNAAATCISCQPEEELATLEAFAKLFEESPGSPTRAAESLRPCDPTDVQAEVLVKGIIPPEYIFAIAFRSHPDMNQHKPACGTRQTFLSDQRAFYGQREFALRNRYVV